MSRRTEKLGSVIRRELTLLLSQGRLKDPRVHELTTITGVKVSGDLSLAKVYYTVLGEDSEITETREGLYAARGFMQRHLAGHLSLRIIPRLSFEYDPSAAYGAKMEEILSSLPELQEDASEAGEEPGDGDGAGEDD